MTKRQFLLTDTQEAALQQAYLRTKDGPTRTRSQAVRLSGLGYPVPQIQESTGCSRTSLMDWCRRYQAHSVAGLVDGRGGGTRATLTLTQRPTVRRYLHLYTPRQLFGADAATPAGQFWTVADLQRAVHHWFGVTWDRPTSDPTLLAACGVSYQRTHQVVKARSEREVLAFEERLENN